MLKIIYRLFLWETYCADNGRTNITQHRKKKFPLVLIAPLMWTLQESDHLKYLTTISFLEDERYQERKFFHMHNQTGIKLAASPTFLSLIKFLGE